MTTAVNRPFYVYMGALARRRVARGKRLLGDEPTQLAYLLRNRMIADFARSQVAFGGATTR